MALAAGTQLGRCRLYHIPLHPPAIDLHTESPLPAMGTQDAGCILSLRQQTCAKTTSVFLGEKLLSTAKLLLPALVRPVGSDLWYIISTAPARILG